MKAILPPLKQAISSNIQRIRKERGTSQERLALKADVDRSYMSQIKRCLANPSVDALLRISNAPEVAPSELPLLTKKKP
jgi:transcriptional regulator with XRE-family HTH domain